MIRIVVVDDDPLVRTGLRLILGADAELGIVGEADDGDNALRVIREAGPDIVLLDIRMPRVDGLVVLEHLARLASPPRAIVLTTFNTDDHVLRALRLGAHGFLLKDADPPEMINAIKAVHRGDPVLSPAVTATVIAAATGHGDVDPRIPAAVADLSPREREVAVALARGLTNLEIGKQLYLSLATVKATVARIFAKLGVDNRVSAAMIVRDAGLLD
ncbi:response regulator [Rhizomonospora bruguierae]|uniref:response regulator n=1 Tax=Rhizomonospora bruguierae TaxID=1581705 RepID=UPI0020BF9FDB|nr:response regulator transcription factor [Micromonospora sp. NBRC 107566]